MEGFWLKVVNVWKVFWSYVIALARLCVWTIIFFFSGLQRILFMRSEVVGVDCKVLPLRCDMEEADDKLAYLDKLCIENPDLLGIAPLDDVMPDDDSGEDDV